MNYEGDLLTYGFSWIVDSVNQLRPGSFLFFPRTTLLLLGALIAQSISFERGVRVPWVQIGIFLLGAFASLFVPLSGVYRWNPALKTIVLVGSVILIALLPLSISPLTFPDRRRQRTWAKSLYASIVLLLLLNLSSSH